MAGWRHTSFAQRPPVFRKLEGIPGPTFRLDSSSFDTVRETWHRRLDIRVASVPFWPLPRLASLPLMLLVYRLIRSKRRSRRGLCINAGILSPAIPAEPALNVAPRLSHEKKRSHDAKALQTRARPLLRALHGIPADLRWSITPTISFSSASPESGRPFHLDTLQRRLQRAKRLEVQPRSCTRSHRALLVECALRTSFQSG